MVNLILLCHDSRDRIALNSYGGNTGLPPLAVASTTLFCRWYNSIGAVESALYRARATELLVSRNSDLIALNADCKESGSLEAIHVLTNRSKHRYDGGQYFLETGTMVDYFLDVFSSSTRDGDIISTLHMAPKWSAMVVSGCQSRSCVLDFGLHSVPVMPLGTIYRSLSFPRAHFRKLV